MYCLSANSLLGIILPILFLGLNREFPCYICIAMLCIRYMVHEKIWAVVIPIYQEINRDKSMNNKK